ncbi:TB2/DP1, HVA22 family-domain-containing protein [Epithele typhae]|uniref:TB2/DP1, HVA22 family-domain-containing protein n=1 Tax=Epithele typhae TaxID=378194 RepID=UPI00200856D7|nr:TB2/DP1, HVA22 family-domain-containing protein [Epithele typhae]KAH9925034.1 TB2/DP1, HVA22 family-domain-containing protein [Epithele typhae]
MFFYLLFRIVSATTAFLYPGYASYKTLSQRPANEAELERWLMYWSVLGCIVAVEYVAEWLVSWLPLYYPMKTLFLLYLALPQTSGSAWLYTTHLRPFFAAHEHEIDTALAQLKTYLYSYVQQLLRRGWDSLSGAVTHAQTAPAAPSPLEEEGGAEAATGPAQLVAGLWSSYGPAILAGGAVLLTKAQASAAQAATSAQASAAAAGRAPKSNKDADGRRRREGELAAGYDVDSTASSPAFEPVGLPETRSRGSSGSRSGGNGRGFEEVEVPSDVEGEMQGHPTGRPGQARGASWFGGWGQQGAGYERVKED